MGNEWIVMIDSMAVIRPSGQLAYLAYGISLLTAGFKPRAVTALRNACRALSHSDEAAV